MPHQPCVIDTDVLHRANHLQAPAGQSAAVKNRRALLVSVIKKERTLLVSQTLINQYRGHLVRPLNDVIAAFLEYATSPQPAAELIVNWAALSGSERDSLRKCRFPDHDVLLLRTAYGFRSTIYSEDNGVLQAGACIRRKFDVRAADPSS